MDADRMVTLTPKPGVGARPAAAKDNYQKMFKEQGCERECPWVLFEFIQGRATKFGPGRMLVSQEQRSSHIL